MFKNLFGKKNDGFYMQIDESAPTSAKPVAKVEPAAAKKDAPAAVEKTAPAAVEQKATEKKAETAPEITVATEGAIAAEIPAPEAKAKSGKTSVKDKKEKKDKDNKPAAKPAASVTPVAAPMLPVMTNFATDYLIKPSSASGRRRPGANMKSFVTMARDVKK